MDLSREARALLDSARMADSAPNDVRRRARQRIVGAVAAGTIGTSAVIAKGATLGVLGSATGTSATFAVSSSLTTTLVSAVVTGLSLGLVAIAPTNTATKRPAVTASAVRTAPPAMPMAKADGRAATIASSAPQPIEPSIPEISAQLVTSGAAERTRAPQGPIESAGVQAPLDVGAGPIEVLRETAAPPRATASFDVTVTSQPTKASIARETELLAEVQRALQQGRPATALTKLNQYDAAFPSGMLREEATASRVMALCAFGRVKDAEHWAAEFFRRYPNSPLSARVRGACRAAGLPGPSGQGTSK